MQSTITVISPNTPAIDDDCLSDTLSSEDTIDEFNKINADHDNNLPLKSIPGAFSFYNEFLKLDNDNLVDKIANLPYENSPFNKFMKYALIDCERITPVPINDEHKDSAVVVFYTNKNKGDTRLTDGIGSTSFGSNCIVIESSGYNAT
ncbi:hypothetical protein HPULCUR_010175 [Helicostylum pulchrum]|uniref:Uncharacterized protein n=1 Tax=Helicostylum pulchrum TaxID=562976 RepID=A0ABP9YCI8_9FUNG